MIIGPKRKGGRFIAPEVRLMDGSKPVKVPLTDDREAPTGRRRIYCGRYDNCLDYAAYQKWLGFTCTHCDVTEHINPMQLRADLEGMAEMEWKRKGLSGLAHPGMSPYGRKKLGIQ